MESLQLLVVGVLLTEKLLAFTIFVAVGAATHYSMFSFGPLASHFLQYDFFILFFNELSIFTALVIALQYRFIRAFTTFKKRTVLALLLAFHLIFALVIATIQVLPIERWLVGGI